MFPALFLVVAFLAEVLGTVAGFGSSTILLPLALLFFDFKTALVVVAFSHLFGNLGRISFFRSGLDRRILLQFGAPSVALTLVGASLAALAPSDLLKTMLGLFLVAYSVYSLSGRDTRLPATRPVVVSGGATSGFLAGVIGTGGALRGTFLNAFHLDKLKYVATAAAIALAVDLTRIPYTFRWLPRERAAPTHTDAATHSHRGVLPGKKAGGQDPSENFQVGGAGRDTVGRELSHL